MADKKITDLTALSVAPAADDLYVVVDTDEGVTANKTKKVRADTIKLLLSAQITDGIVLTDKLADDAVTIDKLAPVVNPVTLKVLGPTEVWSVGDGKMDWVVPPELNGAVLTSVYVICGTKSTSGLPTVTLQRGRRTSATSAYSFVDMLSTAVTIDVNEYNSFHATTAPVINTANDDLASFDVIRINVDVAGTGTAGMDVVLGLYL